MMMILMFMLGNVLARPAALFIQAKLIKTLSVSLRVLMLTTVAQILVAACRLVIFCAQTY